MLTPGVGLAQRRGVGAGSSQDRRQERRDHGNCAVARRRGSPRRRAKVPGPRIATTRDGVTCDPGDRKIKARERGASRAAERSLAVQLV